MSESNNKMKCIGIIGANGLVGKVIIQSLEKLDYNDSKQYVFYFYGTSEGVLMFNGFDKPIRKFNLKNLEYLDYCILATDNKNALEIYSYALENKLRLIIIDNSSEFRLIPEVPLCIPEINAHTLTKTK